MICWVRLRNSTSIWKESRQLWRAFAYTEYFSNCNNRRHEIDNGIFQDRVHQSAKARRSYFAFNLVTQQDRAHLPRKNEGKSRILRYYWAHFNQLLMKDKILRLLNNSDHGATTIFRTIVTKRAWQRMLELSYSSAGGGHFGEQKTVNKLKQRFNWNCMTRDVCDWC